MQNRNRLCWLDFFREKTRYGSKKGGWWDCISMGKIKPKILGAAEAAPKIPTFGEGSVQFWPSKVVGILIAGVQLLGVGPI